MNVHYGLDDLKDFDIVSILPIILPFFLIGFILVVLALIDLFRNRTYQQHVFVWTLIIVLVNPLGPILYFMIGRKGKEYR
ncbi:PLDc_N domain-containing protein [Niallia circulans]|uniref:PLDc_N domain-containing protein n=1 Tax=Niallia circulans TaxID=1397 RepID=A0A553SSL0_NIACI|nr:PLD nuclease N-terminal domain-containing protein [Niallia circulans]TRZ39985.1 PLDc_N domain-containing protein [Niallia circulans]